MNSVSEFQYRKSDLLGHGAFALVFKGYRTKDKLPVAVKQIRLKNVPGRMSSITQKEIEILKDLRHSNIVQLYDYLETREDVFLIMEYCNGGDMGDYIKAKKTLSEDSIRHLTRDIVGALQVLQAHQIIHRDIKPQNLLLSFPRNGGSKKDRPFREATVKLADFGFARHLSSTDMAATLCGSPLYMAPEILLGRRYDYKADLWSVGTILFECLTGEAPFSADNPHALRRRYARENLIPKVPSGTSNNLSQLLLSMLKKNPTERISYESFFDHSFLSESSPESGQLVSMYTKSSPVPIKRHSQQLGTRHSPQRRGSSVDTYSLSPSSASGPPLSHQIGSLGSPAYLSAQSPRSDITDQGFILVDLPASSGSTRFLRSASHSTSPGSSTTHTLSLHTPSSHGSLTRYNSLTTPFYQARPALPEPSTPTNINVSSGYHSRPPIGSVGSLSRSNSGRKSVPFGQLIQPQTVYSQSPHRNSITSSPSPQITPPTQSSNQIRGLKYAQAVPGSTGRLTSLVEESDKATSCRKSVFEISQSCLLVSDEGSLTEDESFPMGLNMSLNSSQSEEHEQEIKPTGISRRSGSLNRRLSQDLAAISTEGSSSNKIGSFQLPFLFEPQDRSLVMDCPSLSTLKESLMLGRELVAMAKARQGPIMLLSTSTNMSDSGVGSRVQRYTEQLVLYAKAVSMLESSLVVYELNMATCTTEASSTHRQVEGDVRELLAVCLERARNVKDQLTGCTGHSQQVSAEKLLYLEALDMCKSAVLNEKSTGETTECIKRYRRAKLIFQYLLTTATSRKDKALLQKYVTSSENRVSILCEQLAGY